MSHTVCHKSTSIRIVHKKKHFVQFVDAILISNGRTIWHHRLTSPLLSPPLPSLPSPPIPFPPSNNLSSPFLPTRPLSYPSLPPVPSPPLPSPHGVSNPLHLMVEIVHGIHDHAVPTGKVQEESVDGFLVAQDKPGLCRLYFSEKYSLEDGKGEYTVCMYIYVHTSFNSCTYPHSHPHHTTPHTWAVTRKIAMSWKLSLKGKRLLLLYFHF